MARQVCIEGALIQEDSDREYCVEGMLLNEDAGGLTPITPGTVVFVSSGPAVINVEETVDATDGEGTIAQIWQRNEDGGAWGDLVGETADTLADTDITPGVLYGYRMHYTDDEAQEDFSNEVFAEVYSGGVIGGGGGGSALLSTGLVQ